ncbi:hypothetical protein BST27_21480 [Mycobacterium intermedium]|uniref:DUF6542 domain-containing protein n=1 Tax=Mycobacterium intermedium TaxID=28445 RepID=A0A1E3SB93_MYCIE|nr:hypothetical protein BHQ20_20170 [Mycobacterium intermedium]OPE46700.1 hypothetical protein BV508_24990 [Mycobacterium intermedium]ORA98034.1 hypothetical protein BST27_21480 [Mycobacterium intermedium]
MEPSHRSILRNLPGVPWWAAVLLAAGTTAVGYLLDAGHKELTHTFAGLYIAGCVAAVLVVRQSAVFTAVIQPPLILFCAVPGAYWTFHGGKIDKLKDLLINCGYPLIERFPLMLGTAGGVLLLGLIRWFIGSAQRTGAVANATQDAAEDAAVPNPRPSLFSGIAAKLSSLLDSPETDDDESSGTDSQPAHKINRSSRSNRTSRTSRAGERSARTRSGSRSRHARPPLDERGEPAADRPRRPRRTPPSAAADFDADEPPRRSRRRPPPPESDLRAQPPREMRRDPHPRRNPYERPYDRPQRRSSRFDPYEGYEPSDPPERERERERERPSRRRENPYDRYAPYEPPPRRRSTPSGNGASPTHHPISQVRYRTSAPREEILDEPRHERRSRPRAPRKTQPEPWE